MKNDIRHLSLRLDPETLAKLHYIAKYEGRSASAQVMYLVRKCIAEFEKTHEPIDVGKTDKA